MSADDDLASLDLEWGSDDEAPTTVGGSALGAGPPSMPLPPHTDALDEAERRDVRGEHGDEEQDAPSRATMPFALDARAIFADLDDEARGERPTAPPPMPAVVYEESARLRTREHEVATVAPRPRAPMPTVREDLSELARLVELGGTPSRPPPPPADAGPSRRPTPHEHAAREGTPPETARAPSRGPELDVRAGSLSDLDFSELAVPSSPPSRPPSPPGATLLDPGELAADQGDEDPVVVAVAAFDEAEAALGEGASPEERARVQKLREGAERALLSRIGDIGVPVVLCGRLGGPETADMDHRSGFVASLLDGTMTTAELLEVSPLRPVDTLRVVAALMERGLARLES